MPDYLRTLDDAATARVQMIAVCHTVDCRHTQDVDLQQVIFHVGAATPLVPVKGVAHFSERMRCPACKHRGMFIWVGVPRQPEPIFGTGTHPYKVLDWGRGRRGVLEREIATLNNLEVARAAFQVAMRIYPDHHITLQQGIFVVSDSRLSVIEGGEPAMPMTPGEAERRLMVPRASKA